MNIVITYLPTYLTYLTYLFPLPRSSLPNKKKNIGNGMSRSTSTHLQANFDPKLKLRDRPWREKRAGRERYKVMIPEIFPLCLQLCMYGISYPTSAADTCAKSILAFLRHYSLPCEVNQLLLPPILIQPSRGLNNQVCLREALIRSFLSVYPVHHVSTRAKPAVIQSRALRDHYTV
jgi:hypothetical protein